MIDPKDASYIEHLEAEVEKLCAQVQERDVEIKRLRKEKGLSSARDGLTFNDHRGIWSDESGKNFCPKCLDEEKRNPLKTEERGWRCVVCANWYGNPDAPPLVVRRRPGGPQGWMAN